MSSSSTEPDKALENLKNRPERRGKWFICHADTIKKREIECIDKVNLEDEFFRHHPHYHPAVNGFYAIQLSEDVLFKCNNLLRIASYRWTAIKGIDGTRNYSVPENYVWFFEHIRKHDQIGWMDFVSNIGVNAPVSETLTYMGSLYHTYTVIAQYLASPEDLQAALLRGWIFQETAFGALDEESAAQIVGSMRQLGLKVHSHGRKEDVDAYIKACTSFSEFLSRRAGCYSLEMPDPEYDFDILAQYLTESTGCNARFVVEACEANEDDMFPWYDFYKPAYLFVMSDEVSYSFLQQQLINIIAAVPRAYNSPEEFLNENTDKILYAFLESVLSYESDRSDAITAVAVSLLNKMVKNNINDKNYTCSDIVFQCWKNRCNVDGFFASNRTVIPIRPGEDSIVLSCIKLYGVYATFVGNDMFTYPTSKGMEACENLEFMFRMAGVDFAEGKMVHTYSQKKCKFCVCTSNVLQGFDVILVVEDQIELLDVEEQKQEKCPGPLVLAVVCQQNFFDEQPAEEILFYKVATRDGPKSSTTARKSLCCFC